MYNHPLHHELFLELLRSVLSNKVPDYSLFRNLDETIWEKVMATAQKQALLGVCYPALNRLPSDCRPPKSIYFIWVAKANYIRQDNKKKLKVLSDLLSLFENHDIHPVVMKGFSSAILYPEPDLRICGDIDLYIPDKYKEAVKFIENLGFKTSFTHKHHKFYYDGVLIELHHDIISSPFKKLIQYSVHEVEYLGVKFKAFDETTTAILLLTHAVTHLIGPGLGFRHICDLLLYMNNKSLLDTGWFNKYLVDNNLKKITDILKAFVDKLSLVPSKNDPIDNISNHHISEDLISIIEKDLFYQGDCGNYEMLLRTDKSKLFVISRVLVRFLKFLRYDIKVTVAILKHRLYISMK